MMGARQRQSLNFDRRQNALKQLKDKHYYEKYRSDATDIFLISIELDEEDQEHFSL